LIQIKARHGNVLYCKMMEKIARIEDLLRETISEVRMYTTPSGGIYKSKEEAVTSIIAISCPWGDSDECKWYRIQGLRCQDCHIGRFLRNLEA
jgi:hypothetical protein